MFRTVYSSYIENLEINNIQYILTLRSSIGRNYTIYAGGLAGHSNYSTRVNNVHVSGVINVDNRTSSSGFVGGLIGQNSAKITNASTNINIYHNIESYYVGGLLGYNQGYVENSYTIYENKSNNLIGVLTGYNGGTIKNSFGYTKGITYHLTSNQENLINSYLISSIHSMLFVGRNEIVDFSNQAELINEVKLLWDSNAWDFNNLDEFGNPKLLK